MIYEPSMKVAEELQHYFDVFMADARVRITWNHVQLYVAAWQGEKYHKDMGWFDDPRIARDAILESDAYKNRSRFSAAGYVWSSYAKLIKDRPY